MLIGGSGSSRLTLETAEVLAEAETDLIRVRQVRVQLIEAARTGTAASEETSDAQALLRALPRLVYLERYERRAMSRRRKAIRLVHAARRVGLQGPA
jgi:hypothetical protein